MKTRGSTSQVKKYNTGIPERRSSTDNVVVVVQFLSCVQLFEIPWIAAHQASLSFTIYQSMLWFMSTESVMLSNHLILCCSVLLLPSIFPSIRIFSNERPKYCCFSFSISPCSVYSGCISFRIDWLDLGNPRDYRVFSSSTIWWYQFFSTQSSLWSNCHNHTGLLEKS